MKPTDAGAPPRVERREGGRGGGMGSGDPFRPVRDPVPPRPPSRRARAYRALVHGGRGALVSAVLVLLTLGLADARPYAWLGIRIRDLSEQEMDDISAKHGVREGFGVFVVDVVPGAPAEKAGLRSGDVVVAVDGRPVVETRGLQRLVGAGAVERVVRLTVLRSTGRSDLTAHLVVMPPELAGERTAAEFGFVLRELESPGRPPARTFDLGPPSAPAVVAVMRGSPAERAGLRVGDVIVAVEQRTVLTGFAAREALAAVDPERPLPLTVRRAAEGEVSLTLTAH